MSPERRILSAACRIGACAAGAEEKRVEAAGQFGQMLGLAFQIRDDMLDVLSSDAELGKSIGSDAEENKNTYMALYGAERCAQEVHALTDGAVAVLQQNFPDPSFLIDLARSLETRKN